MNKALIQAATKFKKENRELIADAIKGNVAAAKEYKQLVSLHVSREIGLFDDFDQVFKEFEQQVRQKAS
jgi:hypothetical protein